jgi:hypothetical protein
MYTVIRQCYAVPLHDQAPLSSVVVDYDHEAQSVGEAIRNVLVANEGREDKWKVIAVFHGEQANLVNSAPSFNVGDTVRLCFRDGGACGGEVTKAGPFGYRIEYTQTGIADVYVWNPVTESFDTDNKGYRDVKIAKYQKTRVPLGRRFYPMFE